MRFNIKIPKSQFICVWCMHLRCAKMKMNNFVRQYNDDAWVKFIYNIEYWDRRK